MVSYREDHGKQPYVVDIEKVTLDNDKFRQTLWTGEHMQLTVMSIPVGGDIGLEQHVGIDQFIRIEAGTGRCEMGPAEDDLSFVTEVSDDDVVLVPDSAWHNITNIGDEPLKLYTLYAAPDHKPGVVHDTQEDAENDPNEH